MNADSAGTDVRPIVSDVRIAAPIWPPITPPTVRMTVFIPVATPVSEWRTVATISVAIAANANVTPTLIRHIPATSCHGCSWKAAIVPIPAAASSIPVTSGSREP